MTQRAHTFVSLAIIAMAFLTLGLGCTSHTIIAAISCAVLLILIGISALTPVVHPENKEPTP